MKKIEYLIIGLIFAIVAICSIVVAEPLDTDDETQDMPLVNETFPNVIVGGALAPGWGVTTVDSSTSSTDYGSLTLDSLGNPHISYFDKSQFILKYAKRTGTTWNITTVDSAGDVGRYSSLALDGAGNPHISYYDLTNGDLKYAKWTGAVWENITIDIVGDVGLETSLALDSVGNPHISYFDATNGYLKYAEWTGTTWVNTTVDSGWFVWEESSLALDSEGNPHIIYYNQGIKYVKLNGTIWVTEVGPASSNPGGDFSLALDSVGNPHISYRESTNNDLNYAKWTGTSWNITTVDSAGDVGGQPTLALDRFDNPHIIYWDSSHYSLKYAKRTDLNWSFTMLGIRGTPSLALDESGNPRFSYTNSYLGYAWYDPSYISVVSPNGGEDWVQGSIKTINWKYSGDPGSTVSIELLKGTVVNQMINASISIGSGGLGSLSWKIPSSTPVGSDYKIRITSVSNSSYTDTSNAPFTISSPSITVISPNGGEDWAQSATKAIRWNYSGDPGSTVKIEALRSGKVLATITPSFPTGSSGSGSFNLTIPSYTPLGTDYQIRITSTTNAAYTDTSDAPFTISSPSITVISPNGGEDWKKESIQTIQWNYKGNPGSTVNIEVLQGAEVLKVIPDVPIGSWGIGSFNLTIPTNVPLRSDYKMKVTSTSNPTYTDISDAAFTIGTTPISEVHFGEWDEGPFTIHTLYLAETDGFVCAYLDYMTPSQNEIAGYTGPGPDISNLTMRVRDSNALGASSVAGITMPVRKGDYWYIFESNTEPPNVTISWIPLVP